MQHHSWSVLTAVLSLVGCLGSGFRTEAQNVQTLLNWDAGWRYHQSGADLGTDWKEFSYPPETSAPWAGPSAGLFAFEDAPGAYTVHAPISTQLAVSTAVTSFYFRTTFQFSGSLAGLSMYATNLIDDGAAFYLNGTEVYRLRMNPNPNAASLATGGPMREGMLEPFTITNLALLKQGANTMAVEVHQNANNSSDVAFGMKLISSRATPLSITSEPQDIIINVGEALNLTVGVSGGPAVYRWFKVPSAIPISGAIGPTFTIATPQQSSTGQYYSIITNVLGAVTSRVAKAIVLADTEGPLVIDARGDTKTFARFGGAQTIAISFTEGLNQQISTNPANFAVYAGTNFNTRISVTNIVYNFSTLPRIYLFMSGPGWFIGSNYFVVLNGVADGKGNLIAPNTCVPVSWELVTPLARMDDLWEYHNSWAFDPLILTVNPPWYATNYQTSSSGWWGSGRGIFYYNIGFACATNGPGQQFNSFQSQPTLFRRTFNVPPAVGPNGTLRLQYAVTDGLLVYLNGQEMHAYNASFNSYQATNCPALPVCVTRTVPMTNLLRGTNWIAAAVVQCSGQSETYFGLGMEAVYLRTSPLPAEPPAEQLVLSIARQNGGVVLSWPRAFSGYSLQYNTALELGLPWITVSNQGNPYASSVTDGTRVYRLRKP